MNLKKALAMFGYTTESAAQELARAGYGDASAIRQALDNGDKQALSFIPQAAKQVQAQDPSLSDRVKNIIGNG